MKLTLLALLVAYQCGCSNMASYYKGVATVYDAAGTCYDSVRIANQVKEKSFQQQAAADPDGAERAAAEWRPKHDKMLQACDNFLALGKTGFASGPLIEKAVNREKDVADYLAKIVALGVAAATAFREANVPCTPPKIGGTL